MKPIITALASYGMSGQVFHAPFIDTHSGYELRYVVERSKDLSRSRYPHATILRSFEELLEQPDVELVIVNTPNELHFPMSKAALLAGKHVVVEKPFTVNTNQAQELLSLAQEVNRVVKVFHNKKLEGEFKTVHKLIQENILGKLSSFEIRFDRFRQEIGPKKWKEEPIPGAGILYDLGPHLFDQIFTLFGLPNALEADLQVQRPEGKVTDYFRITFYYAEFTAIAQAGMLAQEPFLKYEIAGSLGTYQKYGADPQEALLKEGKSPLSENWGAEPTEQWGEIRWKNGSAEKVPTLPGTYMEFYDELYQNIRHQTPVANTYALASIRAIELAEQSKKSNSRISFI